MNESATRGHRAWVWIAAALALPIAAGLTVLYLSRDDDPALSVDGCNAFVVKHSTVVLTEARRVAGPSSDLSYLSDCESFDSGAVEGAVSDTPSQIEARMRQLGKVVTKEDEDCVEYLLPEDPTASCTYFEYRPHGSTRTFEVSMPDQSEAVFLVSLKN